MNARAATSNPPPKFNKTFVPPSDSSRSQSFASSPVRTFRDSAPPTKRRRLASTPTSSSLSLSTPRSSSSRPEQPTLPDIHDARAASSMRVFNIWSALAERYNRRIDEDDIVDIRTGEVIKDRGVLSELPKRCNFGDLGDRDEDTAISTDPGSEAAEDPVEGEDGDEEDDDDEEEDDAGEIDAFPSNGLVAPQLTRLAPLRPATSSSDADDLREFLKAEEIRRELDGGDDSSEDEINILPLRSTPAKRTVTPAKKNPVTTRFRPLKTPAPDTESEDEFAVWDSHRNDRSGYRARRAPSPEVLASTHSPPPPSSSPGPPSSFSVSSPPPVSHTSLNSNRGPLNQEHFGSPTPRRQPLASTSRRTLEDTLNEIDLEFPPPQPRAPSVFGRRSIPAFYLSLSDEETDEQPHPPARATGNPEPATPAPGTTKKNGSALVSKRLIPFVLIETKPPVPVAPASTVVPHESSAPTELGPVTSPKKGRPRTRPSKDKPPDLGRSQNSKAKLVKDRSREESEDVLASDSTSSGVDETSITRTKKVKSPSPTAKPKSTRSTRSTESGTSTTTVKPKPKTPRKPPEVLVDEGDDYTPPSLPSSPSPAPPLRPRIRGALKRKRRASSGPGSGGEQGSPKADPGQQSYPSGTGESQAPSVITTGVIDIDGDDHGDDPAAGETKPRAESQSCPKTTTGAGPAIAQTNTISTMTSSNDLRDRDNTPNRVDGSSTHFPSPPPLPVGFTGYAHQSSAQYSGHPPPFQHHPVNYNHTPYPIHNHNQYGHGQYPFFQDPSAQALLAQAVTQLAVLMSGGQPQPHMGNMRVIPGNMPEMNRFPGSPGWGMFPTWPPSTPTTSRYPYQPDHQQRLFQGPHFTHDQMGSGAGPSTPSNTFPSSLSLPGSLPVVQETGEEEKRAVSRTRTRSKSKRRVSFVLDPRSGSGRACGANDSAETSNRGTEGSPPMTRGRSKRNQVESVGRGTPGSQTNREGKSKVDGDDLGSELDVGDSDGGGSVDRNLPLGSRSGVRGRTPGPERR